MTHSAGLSFDVFEKALNKAKSQQKLLWLFLAPQSESLAWEWGRKIPAFLSSQNLEQRFLFLSLDSYQNRELDQSAQYLMQTLKLAPGWPVNLIISPESKLAVVGFHMMEEKSMEDFFKMLSIELFSDSSKLERFALESTKLARQNDPLSILSPVKLPEKNSDFKSLPVLNSFYHTPIVQSLDAETGLLGKPGNYFLVPHIYLALFSSDREDLKTLAQSTLTQLCRSSYHDVLQSVFWNPAIKDRLSADLLDQCVLLEALTRIAAESGNAYLKDVAVELISSITELFLRSTPNAKLKVLRTFESEKSHYEFSTQDLLTHLTAPERNLAQKFFSLTSVPNLPTLKRSLIELAKELGQESQDLKLALHGIQFKLLKLRNERVFNSERFFEKELQELGDDQQKLSDRSQAIWKLQIFSAINMACDLLDLPHPINPHYEILKSEIEILLKQTEHRFLQPREKFLSLRAELEFLQSSSRFSIGAIAKDFAERLIKASFYDCSYECGFLEFRYDAVDHFEPSALALEYALFTRALEIPQIASYLSRELRYSSMEGFEWLEKFRGLGVHLAGFVGHFSQFQKALKAIHPNVGESVDSWSRLNTRDT